MKSVSYLLVLFFSNVLGAIGGFGAGLISMPFLTRMYDTKTVVMASSMMCVLNAAICLNNRDAINWKQLKVIAMWMCLGLPFGIAGLKIMNQAVLKLVLGIFMVVLGIYGLLKLRVPAVNRYRFSKNTLRVFLVAGGIVQGAISSGGCFILLYAQQNLEEKRVFRATLAFLWTVVSVVTVIQYGIFGTLTGDSVRLFALGTPAVLLGIWAGGSICRRLSQRVFQYLIYSFILAAGVFGLVSQMVMG